MVTFQPFLKSKQIRSILTTGKTILQICASTPKCIVITYAQLFKFNLRNLIIFSFKNLSVHTHNITLIFTHNTMVVQDCGPSSEVGIC